MRYNQQFVSRNNIAGTYNSTKLTTFCKLERLYNEVWFIGSNNKR